MRLLCGYARQPIFTLPFTVVQNIELTAIVDQAHSFSARASAVMRGDDYPVLESDLLAKLANMLRAEEKRPERERDHELIAIINRTIENLKRQRKQRTAGHAK